MELGDMLPLAEKWKTLNQLVGRAERHQVDTILNDCKDQPTSLFNLAKLLLADKFHRLDLMVELLYDDDTALLNGILSKRWMYGNGENSLFDIQFLMEELFPKVSYICRQKVLHRIGRFARNEVKADQLWNDVNKMYGFDIAFPMLIACSKDVITFVLKKRGVKLSGYQVVALLRKYPDVGLEYFKNNSVTCSKMNPECSPVHYLYKYRLDDFIDLFINYPQKLRFFKMGRNRSTKMIRAHRAKLLQHPLKTSSLLKLDRIQREFSFAEFQVLFESTLPQDPCQAKYCWRWVSKVPTYKQISMVNQAYENVYKIDLNEHPDYMNEEYISMLPEERRLQIVQWNIENANKQDTRLVWFFRDFYGDLHEMKRKQRALLFLPLKPISHSIPELKKLIIIEKKVEMQATLSRQLIETCYFNDDLPEMLGVLKYLSKRTRNDQPAVRRTIISSINKIIKINKMEFSKEHWDAITEIVQVALVFKDKFKADRIETIIQKHIAFRLKSKLPLDDLVTMHLKFKMQHDCLSFDNNHIKNPADEGMLLGLYVKELEKLQLSNDLRGHDGNAMSDETLNDFVIKLIDKIWQFNCSKKIGRDVAQISLSSHPWLTSNFERIAKEEEQQLDIRCEQAVSFPKSCKKQRQNEFSYLWKLPNKLLKRIQWMKDEQNQTIDAFHGSDYYFTKMWLHLPNDRTIRHFLNKDPTKLLENWTARISKMLRTQACVALTKSLKYWNYTTLVNKTTDDCIKTVLSPLGEKPTIVEIIRKCNALLSLSPIMEATDFVTMAREFYNEGKKKEGFAETIGQHYRMREAIAKSLVNIYTADKAFDALMEICTGENVSLAVDLLYSQIHRLELKKSFAFLHTQLEKVNENFHEHIIRLYCTIGSLADQLEILRGIKSTNVSVRYVVFWQSNKLFRSWPTNETWAVLKAAIEGTSAVDADILNFLHSTPEVHTCASKFVNYYAKACFSALCKLKPSEINTFATHLLKIMKIVKGDVLDKILLYDFGNPAYFNAPFWAAYLKTSWSKNILQCRLSNIWLLLNLGHGSDVIYANEMYPTKQLVLGFIVDLVYGIGNLRELWRDKEICQTLLDKFKTSSKSKFFLEIITLQLALLHIEVIQLTGAERLNQFASSFGKFVDVLTDTYGTEIILMAMTRMEKHVKKIFSSEISENGNMIVILVDEILKTNQSKANQMVAIHLLRNVATEQEDLVGILARINQIFKESDDIFIQLFYTALHH